MSVRAYKLTEVKHAKEPTFNCWHNQDIFELAENKDDYNEGGILTFNKEIIAAKLKLYQKINKDIEQDTENLEENINILGQMLKDCGNDDFVDYYCF